MEKVQAIVLRAAGVNCDMETQHALELAGAVYHLVQYAVLVKFDDEWHYSPLS